MKGKKAMRRRRRRRRKIMYQLQKGTRFRRRRRLSMYQLQKGKRKEEEDHIPAAKGKRKGRRIMCQL